MIRTIVPLEQIPGYARPILKNKSVMAFFKYIQKKFAVDITINANELKFEEYELGEAFDIAALLQERGTISAPWRPTTSLCDEPHLYSWYTQYAFTEDGIASGASASSDRDALFAALAEGLERRLWKLETDYFRNPRKARVADMPENHLGPARFAGFSLEQRQKHRNLRIREDQEFEWMEAASLISGKKIFVPAQTATGNEAFRHEPLIRPIITTGLATYLSREEAIVRGALEVIERDAYMIMWLNQMTLPRLDVPELAHREPELARLLEECAAYKLEVDVIKMITDAPAYALCAVVRDPTSKGPSITVATAAGTALAATAAHAVAEALRIRRHFREYWLPRLDVSTIIPEKILFQEHGLYWLHDDRYKKLSFLTAGPIQRADNSAWDTDSVSTHLSRIVQWCIEKNYECAVVDMSHSRLNPTPWRVVNVIMPDMQPLHLVEKYPCAYGARITEVPRLFGYRPRPTPFLDEPHPFV